MNFDLLRSFFSIVEHTSGLEKILFQLVTLPSMWSMVWHVGVQADLQMPAGPIVARNGETWGLHTTNSAYYVPMTLKLNKQPALNVTLVAAPAQPPLLTCAGKLRSGRCWEMAIPSARCTT